MDLAINKTDGYLFSGRDFLPQVQIRLTITTDQPSPKDLIVELRILSSTYIRAYMWVLPESNIGFSDQWAKVNFGHSADVFDKAKTHFLKKGHSPQQRWLKFCVWIKIYVGSRLMYFCSNLTSDKNVLFKMVMKTRGPFASFCSYK